MALPQGVFVHEQLEFCVGSCRGRKESSALPIVPKCDSAAVTSLLPGGWLRGQAVSAVPHV